MSILQKIEKCYGNLIESIKICQDKEQKMLMIGSLAIDIGKRCISPPSKIFHLSRKTIRNALLGSNINILLFVTLSTNYPVLISWRRSSYLYS